MIELLNLVNYFGYVVWLPSWPFIVELWLSSKNIRLHFRIQDFLPSILANDIYEESTLITDMELNALWYPISFQLYHVSLFVAYFLQSLYIISFLHNYFNSMRIDLKGRPGAVVRAVSLSHQVVGSKQPLCKFAGGRLASVFPFPRPHSCESLQHWVCPMRTDLICVLFTSCRDSVISLDESSGWRLTSVALLSACD